MPTNFLNGSNFDRMAELIHLSRCCLARHGGPQTASTFITTGTAQPVGLAVDASGNIYVSEGGIVKKYSPDGTAILNSFGPAGSYGRMAFDGQGNLYVAGSFPGNASIMRIAPDGTSTFFGNTTTSHLTV
jgi:sugar lactone lactonase YvrE